MAKKTNDQFIIGLLGGVAIIAIIGLVIMAIAFVRIDKNGGKVAGEVEKNNNSVNQNVNAQANPVVKPVDLKISADDHIKGNVDAPITILEWSEVQCPFCARFHETMTKILQDYPDQVRWIFRHFPLDSMHQYARPAAEALECAADQDKFWEYSDALYADQSKLTLGTDYLKEIAKKLDLDTKEFNSCVDDRKYQDKVESQYQQGIEYGVRGTPGNFINGVSLGGAVPYEQLKAQIEALLK